MCVGFKDSEVRTKFHKEKESWNLNPVAHSQNMQVYAYKGSSISCVNPIFQFFELLFSLVNPVKILKYPQIPVFVALFFLGHVIFGWTLMVILVLKFLCAPRVGR